MTSSVTAALITSAAVIISFLYNRKKTVNGIKKGLKMFINLVPSILTVLILVSIMLYLVPQETIIRILGKDAGILSRFAAAAVGSISLIPGFIAYPLCGILVKSGVSYSVIAVFITTLMMVGILTLPLEKKYFGLEAAVMRNILSLAGALLIGLFISLMWSIV